MPIPSDLQPALLRQRRFLTLMSLALIAFYVLGVDVQNQAEHLGLTVNLDHPKRVEPGLWVVWGWALWRYSQRVYELLTAIWDEVLEDVRAEDLRIALARAKKCGNDLAKNRHFDRIPMSARIRGRVVTDTPVEEVLRAEAGEEVTHYRDYQTTRTGGRKYLFLAATFDWVDGPNSGSVGEHFQMELSPAQARLVRFRAWIQSALRLPALSDHIGPFVIAGGAVISAFWMS